MGRFFVQATGPPVGETLPATWYDGAALALADVVWLYITGKHS